MNNKSLPRSIRNNNPANIKYSYSVSWRGLVNESYRTDKVFCEFCDIYFGIRAFLILCRTYRKKYGIKSVTSFIRRFAPSSENDTKAYVSFVLDGCNSDILASDGDYDLLAYLIFFYEASGDYVSLDLIRKVRDFFQIKIV